MTVRIEPERIDRSQRKRGDFHTKTGREGYALEQRWYPPCFASGAVYSCSDSGCPYRAACEGAVSPWFPYP